MNKSTNAYMSVYTKEFGGGFIMKNVRMTPAQAKDNADNIKLNHPNDLITIEYK